MEKSDTQPSNESKSLTDLTRVARVILKRKWVVVVFCLASLGASVFYTKQQRPVFESTVTLVIERKPPRVLAGTDEVFELGSSSYWSNKEYYQTQYNIIKSREIAARVVEMMALAYDDRFLSGLPELPPDKDAYTHEEIAEILASRINVEPVADSMMVHISATDNDPELAMSIANGVASAYREYNLNRKQRAVDAADRDLEELVKEQQARKEEAEQAVVDMESDIQVGTVENEKQVLSSAIIHGEAELEALRRKIDEASARVAAFRRFKGESDIFAVGVSEVIDNPFIRQLKTEYVQVQGDLARLQVDYLERHPAIKALKKRLAGIKSSAKKELGNILSAASRDLDQLVVQKRRQEERLAEYRGKDMELAKSQVAYKRLVADRDQAQAAFAKVNKRLVETQMSGQIRVNNVRILDAARLPVGPIKPNLRINMILGLFLGLFGGVALAFLVEFLDNTIKAREDVEQIVGSPYLGTIPRVSAARAARRGEEPYDGPPELYVYHRPMSSAAEFARSIRTNLLFMSPDKPLRTILVTSPSPQEGKTTVATNIAINMASSGGRTVLVDTDLRRPRVHQAFGVKPRVGVSNYLIGDGKITQFVRKTEVDNLDILPCGPCPPNPAELLHTAKFKGLIDELLTHYQTVVFDSPPVNYVTDAQIIATQIDGVVMVAKFAKTTRDQLGHARRLLDAVNARILGCVLNDLDLESRGYGNYYGAGRYAYGYGQKPDEVEAAS